MLRALKGQANVNEAWVNFQKEFTVPGIAIPECRLTYRPGQVVTTIYWLKEYDVWGCFSSTVAKAKNRYWNAFGIGRPIQGGSHRITCEICIPMNGGDERRIAGAFGEDAQGVVYLLHSGKIGGGKPGVGKDAFLKKYNGPTQLLNDGRSDLRQMLVLGQLGSLAFLANVVNFIRSAAQFR